MSAQPHDRLARMQLHLWAARAACEAFARLHAGCACEERSRRGGEWDFNLYTACLDLKRSRYLLRLFAGVLQVLAPAERPVPAPLPPGRDCRPNGRHHVTALVALRGVLWEGRHIIYACGVVDCPICEHVRGVVDHVEWPLSLLHADAEPCGALKGRISPNARQISTTIAC